MQKKPLKKSSSPLGRNTPVPLFWLPGLGAGLAALAVYALTLSRGVFPGRAAALMGQSLGFAEPAHLENPLWGALSWFLGKAGLGNPATVLNAFSAVCGALAVMALFRLAAMFLFNASRGRGDYMDMLRMDSGEDDEPVRARADTGKAREQERRTAVRARRIALAGGTVAAFALAFTLSFWLASTHLQYGVFDTLLLGALLLSLYGHVLRGGFFNVFATAFLAGASLLEAPIFLLASPAALVVVLVFLVKKSETLPATIPLFVFSLAAGIGVSLGAAHTLASIYQMPAGDVLLANIPSSLEQCFGGMPALEGWWVCTLTLAPVLFTWWAAEDGFHRVGVVNFVSHLLLTLAALFTFCNHRMAPWQIAARSDLFPCVPMFFAAFSAGYLFTHWLNMAAAMRAARKAGGDDEKENLDDFTRACAEFQHPWLPRYAAPLLLAAMAVFFLAMPAVNFPFVAYAKKGFADRVAAGMAANMGDDNWVFSTTPLAGNLRIQKGMEGQSPRVLNLDPADPMRTDSTKVNSACLDLARGDSTLKTNMSNLALAADVSTQVLLTRLVHSIPGTTNRTLCAGSPTLFHLSLPGAPILPRGFVYACVPPGALEDPETRRECLGEKDAFLAFAREWLDPADDMSLTAGIRASLRRQAALSINMSALFLDQAGLAAEAFKAYGESFEFAPGNLSAVINRHLLAARHPEVDPASEAREHFRALVLDVQAVPPTPAELLESGPVSDIGAYLAELEPRFARTRARMALAHYENNRNTEPARMKPFARLIRAAFFFAPLSDSQDTPLDAVTEALYTGDFKLAGELFNALPEDDLKKWPHPLYAVAINMAGDQSTGDLDMFFYRTVDVHPRSRTAWLLFLANCIKSNNTKDVYPKVIYPLRQQGTPESAETIALATFFHRVNDPRNHESTAGAVEELITLFEEVTPLHEFLLQQQVSEAARQPSPSFADIAATAGTLLEHDPGHPVALYMAAATALATNNLALAAELFEQSLAQWPATPPAAGLALAYRAAGRLDDAAEFAIALFTETPNLLFNQRLLLATLTDRAEGDDLIQAGALQNRIVPDERDPYYVLTRIRLRHLQRRFFEAQSLIDRALDAKIPFTDADLHQLAELARLNQIEILRAPFDEKPAERRPLRRPAGRAPGRP